MDTTRSLENEEWVNRAWPTLVSMLEVGTSFRADRSLFTEGVPHRMLLFLGTTRPTPTGSSRSPPLLGQVATTASIG
jgi:hypothetical protein